MLLMISATAYSQDYRDRKLSREERKELRKAEQAANFNFINDLLSSQRFVVEADFLETNMGTRYRSPRW